MPTKSPKRGHLKPPPKTGRLPLGVTLRGVGKSTRRVSETTSGPSRKGVAAQRNTRGKRKQGKRSTGKPLAASRPKKKASEGSRRIPKTHGAQNGTPKNHQEEGRTAKTGETKKRRDTNKKRNQQNQCV